MFTLFPPGLQPLLTALAVAMARIRQAMPVAGPAVIVAPLSVLLLWSAVAVTPAAEARSGGSQADVKRILAPVKAFDRAVMSRWGQLEPLGRTWAEATGPCVQETHEEIERRITAGDLRKPDGSLARGLVTAVAIADAALELRGPLERDLVRAERAFRRMPLRDRVLRAGARAKARQVRAVRTMPDIDTCRWVEQWAQAGYGLDEVPEMAPGAHWPHEIGGAAAERSVSRAARRLRQLRVSRTRVLVFEIAPVASMAAPAFVNSAFSPF
jgi:hypothetical protein